MHCIFTLNIKLGNISYQTEELSCSLKKERKKKKASNFAHLADKHGKWNLNPQRSEDSLLSWDTCDNRNKLFVF